MKLETGMKMPSFTYLSPYREGEIMSEELLAGKPFFIVFLRYYGCTMCRVDMHSFTKRYTDFAGRGIGLGVVLQSDPVLLKEEAPEGTFPFEVMCDPDMKLYERFDIAPAKSKLGMVGGNIGGLLKKRKEAKALGFEHGRYEGNEQQLPRLVLVGSDGVIRYSHYARNIADMPGVDEMLSIADRFGQ